MTEVAKFVDHRSLFEATWLRNGVELGRARFMAWSEQDAEIDAHHEHRPLGVSVFDVTVDIRVEKVDA